MQTGSRFRFPVGPRAALIAVFVAALAPGAAAADWDPIPPEQLAQARGLVDPDADAEVLRWVVSVNDYLVQGGLVSERRHHARVKIFTEAGAQRWSQLRFEQPPRSAVRIVDIEARTVLPDGTSHRLAPGAMSEETVLRTRKARWKRISCALPRVEPGSIIEFRYTEDWTGPWALFGYYPMQLEFPAQEILYKIQSESAPHLGVRLLAFHVDEPPQKAPRGDLQVLRAVNQPAFVSEPDMPPLMQQLPFVMLFYSSRGDFGPEAYWPKIGSRHAWEFEARTRPDAAARRLAASITEGAAAEGERVERIAHWMQGHFRVARAGAADSAKASGPRHVGDAAEALRLGGGDREDALLVFGALLRAAGLDPRLVLVSSRQEMFFHRNMTLEDFLDSRLVAVRLGGEWACFDPATESLPWDMLDWDVEGATALLCDRDSSVFIGTPIGAPERSTRTRRCRLELHPDGSLSGTMETTFSGHLNASTRAAFENLGPAALDSAASRLEHADGTPWVVSRARLRNAGERREPLALEARVVWAESVTRTGSRMLFTPAVFQAHARPRYTSSRRRHPVYFEHAWSEIDTVRIRLPEGWRVQDFDDIPPRFADGVADYVAAVQVSEDGRDLTYVRRLRMGIDGSIYIPAEYYPGVKQFFDDVLQRDGVTLSLRRSAGAP